MVKLSIVIPYYNTYDLTDKLLSSLQAQLTNEVEIIVVDDGCNEYFLDYYERKNKNITIIHQVNQGVSASRNVGINKAIGKYVAFIDSDDMVMPNYVDSLLELINTREEDVILFNWLDINTNDVVRHPQNPAVWKAIYKKEIIPRFNEDLKVREDFFFQQELNTKAHTNYYYDKVLYIYNSGRENSLSWRDRKGEFK